MSAIAPITTELLPERQRTKGARKRLMHRNKMHVGSIQNRWQIGAGRLVIETDSHECPLVDEPQAVL